jgi:hypothetical protein
VRASIVQSRRTSDCLEESQGCVDLLEFLMEGQVASHQKRASSMSQMVKTINEEEKPQNIEVQDERALRLQQLRETRKQHKEQQRLCEEQALMALLMIDNLQEDA